MIPFIGPVLYLLRDFVAPPIGSLRSIQRNVEDMTSMMEDLIAQRTDIEREISDAKRERKQCTHEVARWLQKVGDMDVKVTIIKNRYEQRGCCILGGCSLNCWSGYWISMEAEKLQVGLLELKSERAAFVVVAKPLPPETIQEMPTPVMMVGESVMESHLEMVHVYLRDDNVRIVGIWGMGGVGKTTLLKKINNSMLGEENLGFDHVIWVSASKNNTIEKLQSALVIKLGLGSPLLNDVHAEASNIFYFLKDKNFLLLLDDLWEAVDLTTIGIPHSRSSTSGSCHHKHKVVFTTRSEVVCARMNTHRRIKVECLQPQDAWNLFKENVGAVVINSDPKIPHLALEVANECGGLPLALIVIGQAMSTKRTPQEWEDAIRSLKKSQSHVLQAMEDSMFPTLRLSYDNLRNDILRECFLCCSLWPGDRHIGTEDLIECWMGLGLLDDFDEIHETYNHGYSIVGSLEEACLLGSDHVDGDNHVKVHDLIRDMALWIVSNSGKNRHRWLVSTKIGLKNILQNVECWELAERISLMHNDIKALPEQVPQCPQLSALILQGNVLLAHIPHGFFQSMPGLKYLDLSYSNIKELPTDISCLVELQHFNLSYTPISSLPEELRNLRKLKYLLLRHTVRLQAGLTQVLSGLSRLQVLDVLPYVEIDLQVLTHLEGSLKALSMAAKSLHTLHDIFHWSHHVPLRRLRIVEIEVLILLPLHLLSLVQPALHELEIQFCLNLTSVEICSGHPEFSRLEKLRLLNLGNLRDIAWKGAIPSLYLPSLRELVIEECPKLGNITWVLQLPCLMKLYLVRCSDIKRVIEDNVDEIRAVPADRMDVAFPSLKELYLVYLPQLHSISEQALAFPSLESLMVLGCPELNKLPFKLQTANSNKFQKIEGEREWLDGLEWEDDSIKTFFIACFRERLEF